jgi:DNA polymerase V
MPLPPPHQYALVAACVQQGELFDSVAEPVHERRHRLLSVLDMLNGEMGQGTVRFACEGTVQSWRMRRENLTPGYTSRWDGLAEAKA